MINDKISKENTVKNGVKQIDLYKFALTKDLDEPQKMSFVSDDNIEPSKLSVVPQRLPHKD